MQKLIVREEEPTVVKERENRRQRAIVYERAAKVAGRDPRPEAATMANSRRWQQRQRQAEFIRAIGW